MSDLSINAPQFFARMGKILSGHARNRGAWGNSNCLSLNRGPMNEDDPYAKSLILHQYLFGIELTDTVTFITESGTLYFLSSKKKIDFLEKNLGDQSEDGNIKIEYLVRNKADGNEENFQTIMKVVEDIDVPAGDKVKLGVFQKEWSRNEESGLANLGGWQKAIDINEEVETVDVAIGMGLLMAVKDDVELDLMKKSSVLGNKILKHGFIPRLEEIIDKDESITHEALAEEIETIYANPKKIKVNVSPDDIGTAYFPILQSGGNYDLKVSALSTQKKMKYDVITISLGSRYKNYCSNVARTFLVDPPKAVADTYETLLVVHEACLAAMVPGKPLKSIYATAVKKLKAEGREDLVSKLPKNLGFAIGGYFREGNLTLSQKNTVTLRPGMTFNLAVGFSDVSLSKANKATINEKSAVKDIDKYALILADTVTITKDFPDILTKHNKTLTDVSYMINDDDGSGVSDNDDAPAAPKGDADYARKIANEGSDRGDSGQRTSKRLASSYDNVAELSASAAERQRKQIELMRRRNEERVRELARARNKGKNGDGEGDKAEELEAYKRPKEYPDSVLPNQIKVDMANKCVLLPVGGNPVPFHICTIKAAVFQKSDNVSYLRVNFYAAGLALGKEASRNIVKLVEKYAPYATFVREMTFRSLDGRNLNQAYRMIMELRKRYRQKEVQEQEEATLVKQDKLVRTKNERVPRLSDLTMRPVFAGRKTQGNLEAHSNGLRFISNRGESVDIIYSNIEHAIFQPCESEIMVLIHFYLKNPIMIGKKKQRNLQVFTEVIDASQAVDAGRRNMYDPEEMDDEQRERQLRKKLNEAFKDFCRKVEKVAQKNGFTLEFDIPYRDLGFIGNPHKEMVYIMPTLNCLVNLTETPFFVVDLNQVDHVHFERVTFASKAFDMVIANKDFTKQPWRVDMIPNADKDGIQDWLTDMEISYTEGPMNLNWKQIMSTVASDDRFYMDTEEDELTPKEAGWSFLRMFGDEDDEGESSQGEDSDFGVGGSASEDEEEEEEEESSDEESDDESDFDADEELEEQGMDWADMEKQAMADDRRKNKRDDDGGPKRGGPPRGGRQKRTRRR